MWESPNERFLQKQFRCRFGTVGMNKPTIQTKVETKTWILSSVFLTIFNGRWIFKNHFFPKLSVNRTIYRCFAWKNWDLSSCFFDAKKRWVPEVQAFYRKIRSLVGKPFFPLGNQNTLRSWNFFSWKMVGSVFRFQYLWAKWLGCYSFLVSCKPPVVLHDSACPGYM